MISPLGSRHVLALPLNRITCRKESTINSLRAQFRDPTSPFYIAPDAQGPASPDEPHPSVVDTPELDSREAGHAHFARLGFDTTVLWDQPIVWGDHDSFQHVNNVRYARFFESARMHWITSLGYDLGGPAQADAFLRGKGISFILKSLTIDFLRPVTYPDTLLVAQQPQPYYHPASPDEPSQTQFTLRAAAFSLAQRRLVADSHSAIVWYDYDLLRKCDPGAEAWAVVRTRMRQ